MKESFDIGKENKSCGGSNDRLKDQHRKLIIFKECCLTSVQSKERA